MSTYYMIHRRNKKKKLEEDKLKYLEEMAQQMASAPYKDHVEDNGEGDKPIITGNEYQRLSEEETAEAEADSSTEFWVMVSAKRIELEDCEHSFDHEAWNDRVDADLSFLETASNTAAKALFDPQGVMSRLDCDPDDRNGWETALAIHYNYLMDQNLIHDKTVREENAKEDTPLLEDEEES